MRDSDCTYDSHDGVREQGLEWDRHFGDVSFEVIGEDELRRKKLS
jgi:hypothetical protein